MALNTLDKPESITFVVSGIDQTQVDYDSVAEEPIMAVTLTLEQVETASLKNQNVTFVQTEEMTEAGIAVQPYGAFIFNFKAPTDDSAMSTAPAPVIRFDDGTEYVSDTSIYYTNVGSEYTFALSDSDDDDGGDDSNIH